MSFIRSATLASCTALALASNISAADVVGLGLDAEYFTNTDLSGSPVVSRIDPAIDFAWNNFANGTWDHTNPFGPAPEYTWDQTDLIHFNYFSAQWTGKIKAPVNGPVTFYITADDRVDLQIDGQTLASYWDWDNYPTTTRSGSITLAASEKYDIAIKYAQALSTAKVKLEWEAPGLPRQVVPTAFLYSKTQEVIVGEGLSASYYTNTNLSGTPVVTRVDAQVSFAWNNFANGTWDHTNPFGPAPEYTWDQTDLIRFNYFSAKWEGQIQPVVSGPTTFTVTNDDDVELIINGQTLIKKWNTEGIRPYAGYPTTSRSAIVELLAGRKYDIVVKYAQYLGSAKVKLEWSAPGLAKEIVPQSALFSIDQVNASSFSASN